MNKFIVNGNVTKDGELAYIPGSGTAILKFSIANNEGYGEKQQTYFFNCSLFGKRAESLAQYIVKGTSLLIDGKVQIRSYEKDGVKRQAIDVVINELEFLKSNNKKGNSDSSQGDKDFAEIEDMGDTPF